MDTEPQPEPEPEPGYRNIKFSGWWDGRWAEVVHRQLVSYTWLAVHIAYPIAYTRKEMYTTSDIMVAYNRRISQLHTFLALHTTRSVKCVYIE